MPAALTWCPPGEDWTFDQADNWLIGNSPAGRIPAAGDSIVFDGAVTQLPCYGMHGASGGAYAAVSMSVDFPMATVSGDFTTDDLTLAGGAFSNTTTGIDITVTDEFTWTGGAVNSSSYAGALNLDGATANILYGAGAGGTVNLGDTLNLVNGTVLTMGSGTINWTNDDTTMEVSDGCGVNVDPQPDQVVQFSPEFVHGVQVLIESGAYVRVLSGYWQNAIPLKNLGGEFTLKEGTKARFQGHVNDDPAAPSFLLEGGVTYLTNGTELINQFGMKMTGGSLITLASISSTTVTISGTMTVTDGEIILGEYSPGQFVAHVYSVLHVTGDVTWIGGTYRPAVLGMENNTYADLWESAGQFNMGGWPCSNRLPSTTNRA